MVIEKMKTDVLSYKETFGGGQNIFCLNLVINFFFIVMLTIPH
jgi:hypothetical protein